MAICRALVEHGWNVRYITSRFLYDPDIPIPDNYQVDHLYFRGLEHQWLLRYPRLRRVLRAASYLEGHLRLLAIARKERPDIVHIQWSRLPRLDLWLIRNLKSLGIPIVHTVHDVVPLFDRGAVRRLEPVYAAVDAIMVHASANREAFLKTYPAVNPDRVHVLPFVVQGNAVVPDGADQASARAILGFPADAPVALFFGSIKPYKGLDVLVEAFRQAIQKRPDLHLLVVGRSDEPRDVPEELHTGALPNVHLVSEYVPTNSIWQYHLAADVAVLPYRNITQSAALSTILEFGLPAIVTNVGGLPELIDGNGWVVPPDNPPALSEALLEASSDPARLRAMGKRSLDILKERCSSTRVGEALTKLYEKILKRD
jgi:glycosyltransferase involved in cell wall biosynthesis